MGTIQHKEFTTSTKRNVKVNVETYVSADDVLKDNEKRVRTSESFYDMKNKSMRKGFEGVESYDEAIELFRHGYQPTVDSMKSSLKVNVSGTRKRVTFQNEVAGFQPVVPLALMNLPNCMVNTRIKTIKCKVINVYYDMTVNCGISPEEIIENGQKVLSAIMDLESQGYKFNLYAVQSYSSNYDADMLCVKIKSSDKPFDLKRMSVPLTHPVFFRVIGFDWYSKCPVAKYRSGYGRGIAYDLSKQERKEFGDNVFGKGSVYISCQNVLGVPIERLKEVFLNDSGNDRSKA